MASIEFLTKRIESTEAKVEKLTKKMERIKVALAGGKNPYSYGEYDFKVTNRELGDALNALENYKAQLEKEQEKAESRNIKAIIDFLENWKAKVIEYYHESLPKFLEAREQYYKEERENSAMWGKIPSREYFAKYHALKAKFHMAWGFMEEYVTGHESIDDEKLKKDLDKEADAKYDDIIERTNELIGKIEDASGLRIGAKGDLNGYIIGERGIVKVETISAGGYNIQCYHFRTLVHKVA